MNVSIQKSFKKALLFTGITVIIAVVSTVPFLDHTGQDSDAGYKVYADHNLLKHEPSWTSRMAIEDYVIIKKQYSSNNVEGYYQGSRIVISGRGYELYWDGKRVGYEPDYNCSDAIGNFCWNTEQHPDHEVVSLYNGELLMYVTSVTVLPVFFIPEDQTGPTQSEKDLLRKNLETARKRYREMLHDKDTFSLSERTLEFKSSHPLGYYRNEDDDGALKYIREILPELRCSRFSCPYILFIVLMNPDERYPIGGGRTINGNVNLGGGLVIISSFALNNSPNFQSTIQHELGHSFGLVHIDNYGYSMQTNDSIMSYNPEHHWNNFVPPKTQGILIPEDIRVLAENNLAFPHLTFDPDSDVPSNYNMSDVIRYIPAMDIPSEASEK